MRRLSLLAIAVVLVVGAIYLGRGDSEFEESLSPVDASVIARPEEQVLPEAVELSKELPTSQLALHSIEPEEVQAGVGTDARTPLESSKPSKQRVEIHLVSSDGRPLHEALKVPGAPRSHIPIWVWVGPEEFACDTTFSHVRPNYEKYLIAAPPLNQEHLYPNTRFAQVDVPRETVYVAGVIDETIVTTAALPATESKCELIFRVEELKSRFAGLRAHIAGLDGNTLATSVTLRPREVEPGKRTRGIAVSVNDRLEMHWLNPGEYTLQVETQGRVEFEQDIALFAGEILDLGTIELQPRIRIDGLLVGDARDIAARTLLLRNAADDSIQARTTTNANGAFRLSGIPLRRAWIQLEDDYDARLRAFEFSGTTNEELRPRRRVTSLLSVDTSRGPVEGVRLYLEEPTEIALRTLFHPGAAIECTLRNSAGQFVVRKELVAVDGRASLWVARGSYELSWSRAGTQLGQRRIDAVGEREWIDLVADE